MNEKLYVLYVLIAKIHNIIRRIYMKRILSVLLLSSILYGYEQTVINMTCKFNNGNSIRIAKFKDTLGMNNIKI